MPLRYGDTPGTAETVPRGTRIRHFETIFPVSGPRRSFSVMSFPRFQCNAQLDMPQGIVSWLC